MPAMRFEVVVMCMTVAVRSKYTLIFTGILEYMQVHMNIHKFVKAYKVDIPGYTQIYSGIFVNGGRTV